MSHPHDRYMTAEDLVEHQRETEGEKSYEKTTSILKKFLGNFRNRTHYDDSSEAESSGEGERSGRPLFSPCLN